MLFSVMLLQSHKTPMAERRSVFKRSKTVEKRLNGTSNRHASCGFDSCFLPQINVFYINTYRHVHCANSHHFIKTTLSVAHKLTFQKQLHA